MRKDCQTAVAVEHRIRRPRSLSDMSFLAKKKLKIRASKVKGQLVSFCIAVCNATAVRKLSDCSLELLHGPVSRVGDGRRIVIDNQSAATSHTSSFSSDDNEINVRFLDVRDLDCVRTSRQLRGCIPRNMLTTGRMDKGLLGLIIDSDCECLTSLAIERDIAPCKAI